jgi:sigma-B regulation protein RsbU (phosphoserine phosphatase)
MLEHDQLVSLQQDLQTAHDIQQAILPKIFPPFPSRNEFEIFASMIPAREVGGDFFDFFMIDNDRLGFVIGDVSGKGVTAAIFMAVSRTLIRATGLKGIPAGECMNYVNRLLCNESVSCMFVTVFYGILNTVTGEMEYVNAGHNPPYLSSRNRVDKIEMTGGVILGCIEEHQYRSRQIRLEPGDRLLLYTDGVTEAFNRDGNVYGDDRLEQFIREHPDAGTEELVKGILLDVNDHSSGIRQSDDITLLSIRYTGKI